MDTSTILVVLTAVFGGGGVFTGILAWRKDARQGPVDKQTAQVADALAVSQAASSWVQYQDEKMNRQEARITELADRNEELFQRVGNLEVRLTGWVRWWDDLNQRWHHHRLQDTPPAKPVD